jgi:hypothetical protein
VQRIDHQQAKHPLSITLIGFHAILSRTLDLPRRRYHTADPRRQKRPRQSVAAIPPTPITPSTTVSTTSQRVSRSTLACKLWAALK